MKRWPLVLTLLGGTAAACGSERAPAPASPPAAVAVAQSPDPAAPSAGSVAPTPPTSPAPTPRSEPVVAPVAPSPPHEAETGSARALALGASFARYNAGAYDDAWPMLTEATAIHDVGNPYTPALVGRAALIARDRAFAAAFEYPRITPERLYEAGDWIIANPVYSGVYIDPATGKAPRSHTLGVAAILAFHYAADGTVDRVDRFFDGAAMRMQIGLWSRLPGPGLRILAGPTDDELEFTQGEPNPVNEATVRAITAAVADGSLGATWERYFGPGFLYENINESVLITERDAFLAHLDAVELGVLRDRAVTLERVVSVDRNVMTWTVRGGTYKGGLDGVAAREQRVEVHGFDLWTFAPDGRVKTWRRYDNGLEVLAQLGALPATADALR